MDYLVYLKISITIVCVNCILKHFLCCSSHCVFKQYDSTKISELPGSLQPIAANQVTCCFLDVLYRVIQHWSKWILMPKILVLQWSSESAFLLPLLLNLKRTDYLIKWIFPEWHQQSMGNKLSKLNKFRVCKRVFFSKYGGFSPLEYFHV